jgi:hypothetical protein
MIHRPLVTFLAGLVLAVPAHAASPSPLVTPTAPLATVAASASPSAPYALRATPTATHIRPSGSPTPRTAAAAEPAEASPADQVDEQPVDAAPTAALVRPRAFRTPERDAPAAFAPQGGAADTDTGFAPAERVPGMGANRPPSRSTSGLVVFRVTARTAVEGFDLRVAYPTTIGSFGTSARPADCNAGTGTLVVANDRGNGELRVLVASAQALPFPLDVFCRFTLEPGAGLGANDFGVRVAEVTSNGKRADTNLILVDVVVR